MKTDTSKIHLEILDKERLKLLSLLVANTKDFVLSGGTALSLQIAHRKSFDFDFFSPKLIPRGLPQKISKVLAINSISVDTSDEFTFFTTGKIKVTFLHYPFKHYFNILVASGGLKLFSVKEIAVQKAYTIGRRGEYRDYFDLYSIFKKDCADISEVIKIAEKTYGELFNPKIFLQQLVYFDDLLNFEIISVTGGTIVRPMEVRKYFEKIVAGYVS